MPLDEPKHADGANAPPLVSGEALTTAATGFARDFTWGDCTRLLQKGRELMQAEPLQGLTMVQSHRRLVDATMEHLYFRVWPAGFAVHLCNASGKSTGQMTQGQLRRELRQKLSNLRKNTKSAKPVVEGSARSWARYVCAVHIVQFTAPDTRIYS